MRSRGGRCFWSEPGAGWRKGCSGFKTQGSRALARAVLIRLARDNHTHKRRGRIAYGATLISNYSDGPVDSRLTLQPSLHQNSMVWVLLGLVRTSFGCYSIAERPKFEQNVVIGAVAVAFSSMIYELGSVRGGLM